MKSQRAALLLGVVFLWNSTGSYAQTGESSGRRPTTFEVGATGGAGVFRAEDDTEGAFGVFGAEACTFCSGRFALFVEYNHWERVGNNGYIQSGDLGGFGLRIQGNRRRRIRPFFDVGIAGGADHFVMRGWTYLPTPVRIVYGNDSHALYGLSLGGGASMPVGKRWYVRPQARLYALRGTHVAAAVSVGVGVRF
jgi:hypothetical protein